MLTRHAAWIRALNLNQRLSQQWRIPALEARVHVVYTRLHATLIPGCTARLSLSRLPLHGTTKCAYQVLWGSHSDWHPLRAWHGWIANLELWNCQFHLGWRAWTTPFTLRTANNMLVRCPAISLEYSRYGCNREVLAYTYIWFETYSTTSSARAVIRIGDLVTRGRHAV